MSSASSKAKNKHVSFASADPNYASLREFLEAIGLQSEGYLESFIDQALTLDLLKDMAIHDEQELRTNLKEIGVSKVGHREKIVLGLRKQMKSSGDS